VRVSDRVCSYLFNNWSGLEGIHVPPTNEHAST
jgi:hypothetical protein